MRQQQGDIKPRTEARGTPSGISEDAGLDRPPGFYGGGERMRSQPPRDPQKNWESAENLVQLRTRSKTLDRKKTIRIGVPCRHPNNKHRPRCLHRTNQERADAWQTWHLVPASSIALCQISM